MNDPELLLSSRLQEIVITVPELATALDDLLHNILPALKRLRLAEEALVALPLDGVPSHAHQAVGAWMAEVRAQRRA